MPPLILASTSIYRRDLLARLGPAFSVEKPAVDEAAVQRDRNLPPYAIAATLARMKAEAVAGRHPGAVVIGSDQLATVDGEILGKPGSAAAARAQLARLSGRTHELVTAVSVIHPGGPEHHLAIIRLQMRPLSAEAIARYVEADQPLDCAGAYKLEQRGIALFSAIEGDDHTAIVGLPLLWLGSILARLGYPVP